MGIKEMKGMSQAPNGSLPKPIISVISLHLHISFSYAVAQVAEDRMHSTANSKRPAPNEKRVARPPEGLPACGGLARLRGEVLE